MIRSILSHLALILLRLFSHRFCQNIWFGQFLYSNMNIWRVICKSSSMPKNFSDSNPSWWFDRPPITWYTLLFKSAIHVFACKIWFIFVYRNVMRIFDTYVSRFFAKISSESVQNWIGSTNKYGKTYGLNFCCTFTPRPPLIQRRSTCGNNHPWNYAYLNEIFPLTFRQVFLKIPAIRFSLVVTVDIV